MNLKDKNLEFTVAAFQWNIGVLNNYSAVKCLNCKPQLIRSNSYIHLDRHRMSVNSNQGRVYPVKLQSMFKAFYRLIMQFLLCPAEKQSHSHIQTCLKAQGNLRLVTTNVRLNSSSHYLLGERERVQPESIQKRASHTHTKTHKEKQHKAVREKADFNHLHLVLHFIKKCFRKVWLSACLSLLLSFSTVSAETFQLMTLPSSNICWLCG